MNAFYMTRHCLLTALVTLGATMGWNHSLTAQQPPAAGQDGVEVLTRGPLHEAFAETITFDPEPGLVTPKAPPADIEELPPEQRPAGDNLDWIPGYWAWDDERSDFLWVSGIWRALPPGRQWLPGYWGESRQGFQWTSGYWADAAASEIDYLPEPPATVEAGPNIAATSADQIWIPGSWIWQQNRYAWRPGYWTQGHQNWDWVPDHYVWTPSGYVFVDGYYDYSVARRGVVFAPVYFSGGLRTQRGFSYSPSTVINLGAVTRHLFLRPGSGHYYFGDYYGSTYANSGYSPWFSFHSSRRGYDPIYAHQRWQNRDDRGWEQRAEANYRNLRDNENARPPRNWAAQRALAQRAEASNRRNVAVATPLEELARQREGQQRFQQVAPAERQRFGQREQQYRQYLQQRQQLEANRAATTGAARTTARQPTRRPFSRSPVVAPPIEQLGQDNAPPQRHQVLKPDLQVQPQPRTRGGRSGGQQGVRPGATGQPAAQRQRGAQGQQQRLERNQGNRRTAPAAAGGQGSGQNANRGRNRQGTTAGQQQGASQNKTAEKPKK